MDKQAPKPLVIVKVGSTYPDIAAELGDFEHWIAAGLPEDAPPVTVVDPRAGDALPAADAVAGVIVTGSHSMVTDREPWSEQVAAWLRGAVAAELPVLGICYGHQLLAHALGGEVTNHPRGIELGTIEVERTEAAQNDPLFAALPQRFAAQSAHRQSVRRLPEGAVLLAGNRFEPHHAYRVGDRAWGVQFHPEFSAAATAAYVRAVGTAAEPAPPVGPSEASATVLQRFAEVVAASTQPASG
jgi:GMP synthase (glutamine-hydrolysing)